MPIYSAGQYGGRLIFVERHWTLTPLMVFTQAVFAFALIAHSIRHPIADQTIPITITGRIAPGKTIKLPITGGA
ncbi:hypothetical protein [Variovorax sp. dw_954]|uniref:hypothetical protein n=1 Tax=Variovorax sp. dw_954 TaxID=2720078 RepID=UPI001BD3EEBC|nr:hypothetical protein [Variovorax sp. dw_954]